MPQGLEPHLRGKETTTGAEPHSAECAGLALLHEGHDPALGAKLPAPLLKGQQEQSQKRMAGHCAILGAHPRLCLLPFAMRQSHYLHPYLQDSKSTWLCSLLERAEHSSQGILCTISGWQGCLYVGESALSQFRQGRVDPGACELPLRHSCPQLGPSGAGTKYPSQH